jgi:hypothetical protein
LCRSPALLAAELGILHKRFVRLFVLEVKPFIHEKTQVLSMPGVAAITIVSWIYFCHGLVSDVIVRPS